MQDLNSVEPGGKATVGVMGLGYTGLPLAVGFAAAGHHVIGYDIDEIKLDALRAGRSYLPDIPAAEIARTAPFLTVTGDAAALGSVDAVVVCVPTPAGPDDEPDLRYLQGALDELATLLRPGMLVVIQSTVPPGTSDAAAEFLGDKLGMRPGADFFVANAPERIDPANQDGWTLGNIPKLVGGINAESTRRAQRLLESVCERVTPVRSMAVAEITKVFENTFRMVNIALTYDLADLCRKLDISVRDVVDAAATKPYGFVPHYPGPGVGGECIAVDPLFLRSVASGVDCALPLVDTAFRRIADRPRQVVDRARTLLSEVGRPLAGSRVLVVGVAYKPGVPDTRNAPALRIIQGLRQHGADVRYVDPMVTELTVDSVAVPRVSWTKSAIADFDCLILTTWHAEFAQRPLWYSVPLVLDTWNLVHEEGVFHL